MNDKPSKSQVDKLGKRLRSGGRVDDDDLELLQRVRATCDDALAAVTERLASIDVDGGPLRPTSRLKTIGTIIDKLRRESIRLSQMDDIAGARIVIDGDLVAQDKVVRAITAAFPDTSVKDRREHPSYGYRAVHVIVQHEACSVEVQVRTPLQDLWAQVVERIGDSWGREIRYGGSPETPEQKFRSRFTRHEFVGFLMDVSDNIAGLEKIETEVETELEESQISLKVGPPKPTGDDAKPDTSELAARIKTLKNAYQEKLKLLKKLDF